MRPGPANRDEQERFAPEPISFIDDAGRRLVLADDEELLDEEAALKTARRMIKVTEERVRWRRGWPRRSRGRQS